MVDSEHFSPFRIWDLDWGYVINHCTCPPPNSEQFFVTMTGGGHVINQLHAKRPPSCRIGQTTINHAVVPPGQRIFFAPRSILLAVSLDTTTETHYLWAIVNIQCKTWPRT